MSDALRAALIAFSDLPIEICVELDKLRLRFADILTLKTGHVLTMTKPAGEPLDIYAGGVPLGSGEVLVLSENVGVRVTAHATARKNSKAKPWRAGACEPTLHKTTGFPNSEALDSLLGEWVALSVVVGRAWLPLDRVLRLTPGSFLELDNSPRQPVEVVVNGRVVAYGEVVVVDGNYGVKIQSVVAYQERLAATDPGTQRVQPPVTVHPQAG